MRKLKQRIISLLLAVSMVVGLVQVSPMQVEAANSGNLGEADGIIWLAKEGDGVSKEFSDMIEKQLKLDDMVRDALGLPAGTKVYFDGVNVGNAVELYLNQGKIESMVEEMKAAIRNKEHVVFNIESADGEAKKIAFRSMEMTISVDGSHEIYIKNAGAPANARELENMITDALNNAVVSVDHNGVVETVGFYTENMTGFKATAFAKEGGASYSSLLKKWPTATLSPDSNVRKAGSLDVTIYAAEYSQNPSDSRFKKTQTFEVYMYDERITVNAAVRVGDTYVQDDELESLTKSYSSKQAPGEKEQPVSNYYKFAEWLTPGIDGYDYTAIMKAKIDNNNNGIHDDFDELQEFAVSYYVDGELYDSETVTEGDMPKGPSKANPEKDSVTVEEEDKKFEINYVFAGWETEAGAKWPAKVTKDTEYHAVWKEVKTEIPEDPEEPVVPVQVFDVTGTLVIDGLSRTAQPLDADKVKADSNGSGDEYQIVDPKWATALEMDGYKWVGWYYKVAEGTEGAKDINLDGKAEEVSFNFANVWNTNNGYELELYCEFLPVVEVYDPTTGGTKEEPKGKATKLYSYTIKNADGTEEKLPDSLKELDVADLTVPEYNERVSDFVKWEVAQDPQDASKYTVTPVYTHVENTIGVSDNMYQFVDKVDTEDGATYTSKLAPEYQSVLSIDSVDYVYDAEGEKEHTYAVDSDTSISITPFRNDAKDNLYYVTGLKAYYDGREIDIDVKYDSDYNAVAENAYGDIVGKARSAGKLTGIELVPQYAPLKFEPIADATIPAAQSSYSAEAVYDAVINHDTSLSYANNEKTKVSVLYRAQEDSYTVNLNKLFELLEADGLGALKEMIGEQYNSLEVTAPENQETWKSVEDTSEEATAQEAADRYLEQEYEAYRANSNVDVLQFVGEVVDGLGAAVYGEVHHKFGYISPTQAGTTVTEDLRITYDSDAIDISAEVTATLVDGRDPLTITRKDVTCSYGDPIKEIIMSGLECSDFVEGEFVTYDAETETARNFDGVGVGTYNVQIAYKGDKDFQPAMSNVFKLIVEPKATNVTVEEMLTVMKGSDYADKAAAKVEEGTPIVQVVAGIAVEELAYGLNTEGSVKDWTLGFEDDNLMIDAWVKLPQSYMELLSNLDMVNLKEFGVDLPVDSIEEGKYYTVEDLEKAIEDSGYGDNAQIQQLKAILDEIPNEIKYRLGINGLTYGIKVRFDALEKNVYPTESGFYANYAATLSSFSYGGSQIDKNHEASDDYGFIVISPMAPIPNRGGVQLYDGTPSNAQNVFVYEYDCKDKEVRDLEVALNGQKIEGAVPFYYGLTTRFDAKQTAPSMPGVYFAGYIYTTNVYNTDSKEDEVRRLGSDSAIIIIKQQEAELTINGGIVEYKEENEKPINQIAEIKITDKNGDEIKDSGVTVISGTVNVKDEGTNVTANDFYGTVNIDMPDALEKKWDAYCTKSGYDNSKVIKPADFITFLEILRDETYAAANGAMEGFKELAMKDAVSSALDKINVNSDNLVGAANSAQNLLDGGVAHYNKLIEQLEPLRALNDNLSLTFADLEKEASDLDYGKTGYYLYIGVITDPDMTVDAAKGLVIIHSADDYIMYDTHVPYNGEEQTIYHKDETKRSDVTVMVKDNDISFFLDSDVYAAMNEALSALSLVGKEVTVGDGSDAVVSTVYENAEDLADEVYSKLFNLIWTKVSIKVNLEHDNDSVAAALNAAEAKLKGLTGRLLKKLQTVDHLDGNTRIILYNMANDADLKGMPINAGTYQFYGYDYDVSATRGTLVIEPIYIQVEDKEVTRTYGDTYPTAEECIEISYYYLDGNGDRVYIPEANVPDDISNLISYNKEIGWAENEDAGTYDMYIDGLMLNEEYSHNYRLDDQSGDGGDFVIEPEEVRIVATVNPAEIYAGDDAEVTVTVYDSEDNEVTDATIKYVITDSNGDEVELADAVKTEGKYTITPALADNVTNYVATSITTAELTVKEKKEVSIEAKVEPSEIFVGEGATLTITVKDSDGNEVDVDYDYVINGDPTMEFENIVGKVGTYTVTPKLAEDVKDYVVKENGITSATLVVKPKTEVSLVATVNPSEIYVGDDAEITVTAYDSEDNEVTDATTEYVITDSNGDEVELANALNTAGEYTITPKLAEDVKGYVVKADGVTTAKLTVKDKSTTVIPVLKCEVTVSPSYVTIGTLTAEEISLDVEFSDNLGNSSDELKLKYFSHYEIRYNGVSIGDVNDTTNEGLVEALKNAGNYEIVPIYKGNPQNVYADDEMTIDVLHVIPQGTIVPVLKCAVTVSPSQVTIGTLEADDISLDVKFSDNLGSDPDKLKLDYFSHYDVRHNGYSIGIVSDDTLAGLEEALKNVGTYDIVPVYKGNPEKTYADDTVAKGKLHVVPVYTPVDPDNPDNPDVTKNRIDIWVSTDHSSFVRTTVPDVEAYINPVLRVMVNGRYVELDDEFCTDVLKPTYKFVDSNGNEVELSDIGDTAGTYRFVIECEEVPGYEINISTKYINVYEKQLYVSATLYREDSVASAVPVGTNANDYTIKLRAWDNLGENETTLANKYIDRFAIYDANGNEVTLEKALSEIGIYTIKPIVKGAPNAVYETDPRVYTATLSVSIKPVVVTPVIYYKDGVTVYNRDEIAWKHPVPISTGYIVEPTSFWEDDCTAVELENLKNVIKAKVTSYPEFDISSKGTYTFEAQDNGTTDLDTSKYTVIWGTRTLKVVQIGAQARIRPKQNSIFTTVNDTTYKLPANTDAQTILNNLQLSVSDDHDNAASSDLIAGLKVTKLDGVTFRMKRSTDTLNELELLKQPGTYLIETVISDDIGAYSEVRPDSITVIVEDVVAKIGLGEWKMNLDSVVYLHYYPTIEGFSKDFDFSDEDRAGVVIWTGDSNPTHRDQLMVGKPNTMVIKGWRQNDSGEWYVRTHEIYAKNLGDMVYIRPYVVDDEGQYMYLAGAPYYSPELFAYDVMNDLDEPDGKQNVCAALLHYGASAQIYFDYPKNCTEADLVTTIPTKFTNVKWEDYASVMEYKEDYVDEINLGSHVRELAKTLAGRGEINKDPDGIVYDDSVLDLAGAVRLSTGFNIGNKINLNEIAKAEVLYWNERDIANIDSLEYKYHNYSYKCELTKATGDEVVNIGDYRAQSDHIVAKYLGESVYFTCRIELTDGTIYNSGLGYYSPEMFAYDHVKNSTGQVVEVSKRIIVYSEMAKQWFLGNN